MYCLSREASQKNRRTHTLQDYILTSFSSKPEEVVNLGNKKQQQNKSIQLTPEASNVQEIIQTSPEQKQYKCRYFQPSKYFIKKALEAQTKPQDKLTKLDQIYFKFVQNLPHQLEKCISQKQTNQRIVFQKRISLGQPIKIYKGKLFQSLLCYLEKTVVLDLDETLVHTHLNFSQPHDAELDIITVTGKVQKVCVNIRPFAKMFVEQLSKFFNLIVYTTSQINYARKIVKLLDPDSKYIQKILDRTHCIEDSKGNLFKELQLIGTDLSKTVLVDNQIESFGYQLENAIPIVHFLNDQEDNELEDLFSFIMDYLYKAKDVREVLKNYFKLRNLAQYKTGQEAILKQYN